MSESNMELEYLDRPSSNNTISWTTRDLNKPILKPICGYMTYKGRELIRKVEVFHGSFGYAMNGKLYSITVALNNFSEIENIQKYFDALYERNEFEPLLIEWLDKNEFVLDGVTYTIW